MFLATINPKLNLLTMSFGQHVTPKECQELRPQIEQLLEQLQPGFCILTDLSGLDRMDYACAPQIEQVMDVCRRKGVGKVVRVISDPRKDIGFRVMSYFHYGHGVPITTHECVAEAMGVL
jgi:anti-anti-sigma regulatory factor